MPSEFPSDFPEEEPEEPYRADSIQPIFNILEEIRVMMVGQRKRNNSAPMIEPPPEEELG